MVSLCSIVTATAVTTVKGRFDGQWGWDCTGKMTQHYDALDSNQSNVLTAGKAIGRCN